MKTNLNLDLLNLSKPGVSCSARLHNIANQISQVLGEASVKREEYEAVLRQLHDLQLVAKTIEAVEKTLKGGTHG